MIVRNEAENVTKCFDSVLPYINYYVISDTGSTDNTIEVIKTYFAKAGIDGVVTEDVWQNFGKNRTIVLEHARKLAISSNYCLMMDADDYLTGTLELPKQKEGEKEIDSFFFTIRDDGTNNIYKRQQLFRRESNWIYVCPVHEFAFCLGSEAINALRGGSEASNATTYFLECDCKVISCRKGPIRNGESKDKVNRNDAQTLIEYIETEEGRQHAVKLHCLYHIASCFSGMKEYTKSIEYHKKYIECNAGQPNGLIWYNNYCIGTCMLERGSEAINASRGGDAPTDEVLQYFVNGYNINPSQNECLCKFGEILIKQMKYEKALEVFTLASKNKTVPVSLFFVDVELYGEGKFDNLINSLKIAIAINADKEWNENYKFCLFMDALNNKTFIKSDTCNLGMAKRIANKLNNITCFNTNGEYKVGKVREITYTGCMGCTFNGLFVKILPILVINLGYSVLTDFKDNVPFSNKKAYGSEICAVNLAKQLSASYRVFVVSHDNINAEIDGVIYCNNESFAKFMEEKDMHNGKEKVIDVLILSRYIHYFVDYAYKARKTLLWLHDVEIGGGYGGKSFGYLLKPMLKNVLPIIDNVVVLSQWHREFMGKEFGIPENKMRVVGNGTTAKVEGIDMNKKIAGKFIWTSSFVRGLERCVDYFHLIKKKMPNAVLHIFREYDGFEHLVDKWDYIKFYGKVDNERVVEEFKTASVWFYPTQFLETYCISALEAQANGCLCVCTNIGSLTNVVADRGYLFGTDVMQNKEQCVEFLMDCLKKDNTEIIRKGMEFARGREWEHVKEEWIELFEE
jgi:glycosyltransferase involved in cell wall biosynthesis/tetratricopeptide (TPR) repeat protein